MIQSYITNHSCYKEYRKMHPGGLMLHSTGHANPNAADYISYWNGAGHDGACAHALIDGNTGEVYQTLPFDCEAWHCGGSGNRSYIGVEMCEPSSIRYTGDFTFTCIDKGAAQATVKRLFASAVRLFASLCKQYGIDPLTGIVSHREGYAKGISSNHEDPEHLWNGVGLQYTMDDFRRAVKAAMTDESSIAREQVSGTIEVIVSGVEVHDTPDFDEASRNHVHGPVGPGTGKGSQFTVTERITLPDGSRMYRLKSGLYITASEKYVRLCPEVQAEDPNADAVRLRQCSTDQFVEWVGGLAKRCWDKYRLLPSVTIAQAMLESGIGKTELACGLGASEANIANNGTAYGARNLFGIKRDVSKGTWESDVWKGDTYYKQTAEQRSDGSYINIWSYFRRYDTIEQSVEDRAQYLTRARTETGELRFAGIAGETDPQRACEIIRSGGYATSLNYVKNLMARITKYNLTRFDPAPEYDCWTAKVINTDELNVRRTPNGEVMELTFSALPVIVVTGEAKDEDGDTWYQVKIGDTVTGYVWPDYLGK